MAFFIPIITPAYFKSKSCTEEYIDFLSKENRLGRKDLILPVYYVSCREKGLNDNEKGIYSDVFSRQYHDWREMRHVSDKSTEAKIEYTKLSSIIAETYFEIADFLSLSSEAKHKETAARGKSSDYLAYLLKQEINYENLLTYSVEQFRDLAVSPGWTRAVLDSLNPERYKTISDIDHVVRHAKIKVAQFAENHPELFNYSIDWVSKSLIFSDSEFRNTHPVSPITLTAAEKANISIY